MTRTRRGLLTLVVGALAGCLGRDGPSRTGPNESRAVRDDAGQSRDPSPASGTTYVGIHGEFVEDESAVPPGYEILDSDDEPFDGNQPFRQLFEATETVPPEQRGSRIPGATARSESEEAATIADAFRATSDAAPRTISSNRRFAPRYVRHDGDLLRVEYYSFVEE